MQSNLTPGRHRKPTATRAFAARTAVSAGAAVAAVLMAGGPATATTATNAATVPELVPAGSSTPAAEPPCTGTPLDAMFGPIIGSTCGSGEGGGPGDEEGTAPGSPGGPGGPPGGSVTAAGVTKPIAEPPCTGTPLDAMVGPIIGSTCGAGEPGSPGDEDSGDPGTPPPPAATYPSVAVEDPPAPGGAPLPISCTGSPLDAFTTCGQSGHAGNPGSDRGDAVGSDTPSYGDAPADEGDAPPPPAG